MYRQNGRREGVKFLLSLPAHTELERTNMINLLILAAAVVAQPSPIAIPSTIQSARFIAKINANAAICEDRQNHGMADGKWDYLERYIKATQPSDDDILMLYIVCGGYSVGYVAGLDKPARMIGTSR